MTATLRRMRTMFTMVLAAALVMPAGVAGAQATAPAVDYQVVSEVANEPMTIDISQDGRIFYGNRDGSIFVVTPDGLLTVAANLDVAGNLCPTCGAPDVGYNTNNIPPNRLGVGGLEEGGLQGILLDNDFLDNGQIYVYRSIPNTRVDVPAEAEGTPNAQVARGEGEFHLSRFTVDLTTNVIDPTSEEVLLTVPAEWDFCCHYSGDLDYLPDGTITLTTGDDAGAESSEGYGPRDASYFAGNAEWTSANPEDRRGKVLRLTEDGEVPGVDNDYAPNPFIGMEGFIPDTLVTDAEWVEFDPYVYSMGYKQPWRAVVHPSGTMYVSDVGPDSSGSYDPSDPGYNHSRGPAGLEEINAIPAGGGGHAGWPRCVGPNIPYTDVDWAGDQSTGGPLNCGEGAHLVRPVGGDADSVVSDTMLAAELYYPSAASDEWPIVGTGGKTSEPVAFYPDHDGALALPDEFNDRLLVLEWSRKYILTAPSDPETGEVFWDNDEMFIAQLNNGTVNPDPSTPQGTVSVMQGQLMAPIDGAVNPVDGAFYFLEYGAFFYAGANGRLSRIKCAGCQPEAGTGDYGVPAATAAALPSATAGFGDTPVIPFIGLGALLSLAVLSHRRRRTLA